MTRASSGASPSHYGTHPDVPDERDLRWEAPRHVRRRLPRTVDLRPACPPVTDQRPLNSCSAHAIAAALWYQERREGDAHPLPSRLFLYYAERARERKVRKNASVSLRDGYKAVVRHGICPESLWPYDPDRFAHRPPAACWREAKRHRPIAYKRVTRDLAHVRGCLAEGFPFTAGISVYESFESRTVRTTGRAPMPGPGETRLGGHAVLVVGYREESRRFIVRNSWGPRWGLGGYFTIPYAYILDPDLAWDLWTVRETI